MAKTASPIKHSRTEKDDTYIEERGLRRIELHTEKPPGKKSIFDSEYPFDSEYAPVRPHQSR